MFGCLGAANKKHRSNFHLKVKQIVIVCVWIVRCARSVSSLTMCWGLFVTLSYIKHRQKNHGQTTEHTSPHPYFSHNHVILTHQNWQGQMCSITKKNMIVPYNMISWHQGPVMELLSHFITISVKQSLHCMLFAQSHNATNCMNAATFVCDIDTNVYNKSIFMWYIFLSGDVPQTVSLWTLTCSFLWVPADWYDLVWLCGEGGPSHWAVTSWQ